MEDLVASPQKTLILASAEVAAVDLVMVVQLQYVIAMV